MSASSVGAASAGWFGAAPIEAARASSAQIIEIERADVDELSEEDLAHMRTVGGVTR